MYKKTVIKTYKQATAKKYVSKVFCKHVLLTALKKGMYWKHATTNKDGKQTIVVKPTCHRKQVL